MSYFLTKKGRVITLVVTSLLVLASIIMSFFVKSNYDMTKYLSQDSNTYKGIEVLEESFGKQTQLEVVVKGELSDAITVKQAIISMDYVDNVIFLDDYVDLSVTPIEFIPSAVKDPFINGDYYKITVALGLDGYDERLDETIKEIEDLATHIRGEAVDNKYARDIANKQLLLIMVLIIPVCIILLILFTHSYIEALIVLVSLGVAIILNMGTNLLLGEISFITMTMAMALQLAMSFDYSLFFLHRLHDNDSLPKGDAIKHALKSSFKSITASSFTTIFGFVALMFMQYKIGLDIGIVLAKGIIFSYLSMIFLMPTMVYLLYPLIGKTKHKVFMPKFTKLSNKIVSLRTLFGILFILFVGFGLFLQTKTTFTYQTHSSSAGSKVYDDNEAITDKFGANNTYVILFKEQSVIDEVNLVGELSLIPEVTSVQSLVTTVDPSIPRSLIPDTIKLGFLSNGYGRIILNLNINKESKAYYELDQTIRDTVEETFNEAYYIGIMPSTGDIRQMVLEDNLLILILSLVLVGLVVGIVFKSWILPLLLLLVIESSIWMNIGLSTLTGDNVLFIGYLVVMSIQLGATIDYAVLVSSRYIEERKSLSKKEALHIAISKSLPTLILSALILSVAGLIEFIVSDMDAIKTIGLLLSRGTVFAFIVTTLFLPSYLYLLDKWIIKKHSQS